MYIPPKNKGKKGRYKLKLKSEMSKTFSRFMQSDSDDSKESGKDALINDMIRVGKGKEETNETGESTLSFLPQTNTKIIEKKKKNRLKNRFKPSLSLSAFTSNSEVEFDEKKTRVNYVLGKSFKGLQERIDFLEEDEEDLFDKEFEELIHVDHSLNREEGMFRTARDNIQKNRFKGILANEKTRVHFNRNENRYINANFIPSIELFSIKDNFIATQAPLPTTVDDFWDMIWEQNSRIIVMFQEIEKTPIHSFMYDEFYDPETSKNQETSKNENKTTTKKKDRKKGGGKKKKGGFGGLFNFIQSEPEKEKANKKNRKKSQGGKGDDEFGNVFRQRMIHPYWPDQGEYITKGTKEIIIYNENEDRDLIHEEGIIVRRLMLVKKKDDGSGEEEERELYMFQYVKWPDMSVPLDPVSFLNLVNRVRDRSRIFREELKGDYGPLVLHCVAGVGRTGTFACVYIVVSQLNEFVKKIKKKRKDKKKGNDNIFESSSETPTKEENGFDSAHESPLSSSNEKDPQDEKFEYNFFDLVMTLKKHRKGMVQRIEQYKFCYKVVLEEALNLGLEN